MSGKRLVFYFLMLGTLTLQSGAAEDNARRNITEKLNELFPEFNVTEIRESTVNGLYEVMDGAEVFYVTADGRFLLTGNMYDLEAKRNLTDESQTRARLDLLKEITASEYIEFAPQQSEHVLYVFTDITCSYCRKLHSEIEEINDRHVSIRYLAFPRRGESSEAFSDMESVWCAKDRQKAMTAAKLGDKPVKMKCSNPVASQFSLGKKMGVRGTPALITDKGEYIGGYMSPDELLEAFTDTAD